MKVKKSIKKINVRGVIALVFFIITLFVIGYYVYMKLELSHQEKVLKQKEKELVDQTEIYAEKKQDMGLKKYNAAKQIAQNAEASNWKESTEYLIDLYDTLVMLDKNDRTLELESYSISKNSITVDGKIASLTDLYNEGGFIDKIESLDFIEFFNVNSYEEKNGEYIFTLTADIVEYEG